MTAIAFKENAFLKLVTVVSIVIPLAVAALFWMPFTRSTDAGALKVLPLFHAILNGSTFVVLSAGFVFILQRKILLHRTCMMAATGLSAVFLVSYVVYHAAVPEAKFLGAGSIRTIYFIVLISHILLAGIIVPMALITLYRGLSGNYAKHKPLARWTLPVWLYVALTGVIVYIMMKPYYPA